MKYKVMSLLAATFISCNSNCYNDSNENSNINTTPPGAEKVLSPLEQAAMKLGEEGIKFAESVELIGDCKQVQGIKECKVDNVQAGEQAIFDKIRYGNEKLEIHSVYNRNDEIVELKNPATDEMFSGRLNIRTIDYINIKPPKHLYRKWTLKMEGGKLDYQGNLQVDWKEKHVLCYDSLGEKLKVQKDECVE